MLHFPAYPCKMGHSHTHRFKKKTLFLKLGSYAKFCLSGTQFQKGSKLTFLHIKIKGSGKSSYTRTMLQTGVASKDKTVVSTTHFPA